jgi:hypothetical protein
MQRRFWVSSEEAPKTPFATECPMTRKLDHTTARITSVAPGTSTSAAVDTNLLDPHRSASLPS